MLSVIDTYLCCVGWRYKLHWMVITWGIGPKRLYTLRERLRHSRERAPGTARHAGGRPNRHQARKGYRAQPYPGDIALFGLSHAMLPHTHG